MKKKRTSVFSGLVVFVLLVVIACTAAVNLLFSGERVPKIAGYYLYMQETDDMKPTVEGNSLVFAEPATVGDISEGNVVLCYLADGTLALRSIYKVEETDDGTVNYYPGTNKEQGTDLVIPRTNIFALCIWASPELYAYVQFSTTVTGLMCLLVAPCVILIIMLLVHIARNGEEDIDDEEFTFEEEQPKQKKKAAAENPLYDPETAPTAEKLEEKKSSISENFAAKPVNENSPYQKAVQEREKTMKFRRQEIEEEALRALEEPYPGRKKPDTQVYSAEQIREQARLQAQKAMHPEPEKPVPEVEPVPEPKPIPEKPSPIPAPEPPKQEIQPEKPKPAPVSKPNYSSPNIDDILNADKKAKSSISSQESIDDLIRLLENEKKKL